ncbi:MAG: DNA-binding protein [Acidobacteriota bacterium]
MKVAIDFSKDQAARLNSEAKRLGVSPEALVKAAVVDMLDRKEDFASAASYVLGKNQELYERLS